MSQYKKCQRRPITAPAGKKNPAALLRRDKIPGEEIGKRCREWERVGHCGAAGPALRMRKWKAGLVRKLRSSSGL